MPNLDDVAKLCGVSRMTVSRVINNSGPVKEETRQKVLRAINQLNYVPNLYAKGMAGHSLRILSVIVPDIVNPFYTSVVRGVEDVARKNQYKVIICNHDDDPKKEEEYIRSLLALKIDGFLIIPGGDFTMKHLRMIIEHQRPVVMVDRKPKGYVGDFVAGDSFYGAVELVEHLVARSHRKIAFVNGPTTISTARDRLEGYKYALQKHGIPYKAEYVYEGSSFNEEMGELAVNHFLTLPEKPTAVFAANNFIAIGIIRALRRRNMDVPNDIALSCFEKIEVSDMIKPTVTAMIQPSYNFGTIATQLLLERIEGLQIETPRQIILRPEMILGESTEQYVFPSIS